MQRLLELIALYPNLAATVFGFAAATISGITGYFLKRPMQRQAVASALFNAQIEGFEKLIRAQRASLNYYESQWAIRDAYEADLQRRLRECEERHGIVAE